MLLLTIFEVGQYERVKYKIETRKTSRDRVERISKSNSASIECKRKKRNDQRPTSNDRPERLATVPTERAAAAFKKIRLISLVSLCRWHAYNLYTTEIWKRQLWQVHHNCYHCQTHRKKVYWILYLFLFIFVFIGHVKCWLPFSYHRLSSGSIILVKCRARDLPEIRGHRQVNRRTMFWTSFKYSALSKTPHFLKYFKTPFQNQR